jgi:predicted nucleic acid-binding protein
VPYLVDTSILLRLANGNDAKYGVAINAVAALLSQGEMLHTTPQCMIEFHNGAIRPAANNGLGLPPHIAAQAAAQLEIDFPLLPDTPAIYPAWKWLVETAGVSGKQVHDTRLAVVCHVHGISHLLTFNPKDFLRFQTLGPGLAVVDPNTV